jgi:hypothetical protein
MSNMSFKPKIVGISTAPFASISEYLKLIESLGFLIIDLNKVAAEILKKEFNISNLEQEEILSNKEKIWATYGKSYLANKAITDWIPWVESHAEVDPGFYDFVIYNIETVEEVKFLRTKYNNKFVQIGVIPSRSERMKRFTNETKQKAENFCRVEDEFSRSNHSNAILMSDFIITTENDFEAIKKLLIS